MSTRFTSLRAALCDAGFSPALADYVENRPTDGGYVVDAQIDGQLYIHELGRLGPLEMLEGRHFSLGTTAAVMVFDAAEPDQGATGDRLVLGVTAGDTAASAFRWPLTGAVEHLGAGTGLLPDALARALLQTTIPPTFSTNRFWSTVWMAEILRHDGDLEPAGVAALHPGVLVEELADIDDLVDLYQFLAQRHRDHVVASDWAALRDDAECGRFPFFWLRSARLAWWHDEGSFARAVEAETWEAAESMLTDQRLPHAQIRVTIARLAGLVG